MKKIILSGVIAGMMVLTSVAQHPNGKSMTSADRAKNTVDRISKTVTFNETQKSNLVFIYTKFFDDVHAQQAYKDPAKMEPLEKTRDAKVKKSLNNEKLYKQYENAVKEMKAQFQERQRQQQGKP
ncbi:MAG: hypothetical protein NTU98_09830 [Bacteroidetes bacterium]|nr:hypothetical protein [Bacteroidota bacterium]